MKCQNPHCKTDPRHIFGIYLGDLCSACFDRKAEREKKLPLSEKEMAQRNERSKVYYKRNRAKLAIKRRARAAAIKKLRQSELEAAV